MQINKLTCSSSSFDCCNQQGDPSNCVDQSTNTISFKFDQSLHLDEDEEEFVDCESGEEDSEFTFMSVPADRPSKNNPVFPLFDQNLLSNEPRVEKVFVEMPQQRVSSSSTSESDQIENIAVGPYCTWSKRNVTDNPELNKKSNSTGFSKLWRLRGKVNRSNSDGRDAFVFLKSSDRKTTSSLKSVVKRAVVGGKPKVVKKGTKGQNANVSAHEVYLKKREQTEEEGRRSYLPYRPEIMGFFTNVNGGLSKNVHPY